MKYYIFDRKLINHLKEIQQNKRDMKDFWLGLKIGYWVCFAIIIINILLSGNYVLATGNISYQFQEKEFFNSEGYNWSNAINYSTWNLNENPIYYNGSYPATYSFDDEVGYINSSITFINFVSPSTYCKREIINSYYNHNSVLNCTYDGGSGNHFFYNILDVDKNYGIIEFWCLFDSLSSSIHFYGRDSAYNILYHILATATNFYYYDGSTYTNTGITSTIHTWYHIKLEFNSTSDKWSFWLNGKNIVIEADFQQTSGLLSAFTLMYNQLHKSVYLDAIGYSWDTSYSENENTIPDAIIRTDYDNEIMGDMFSFKSLTKQTTIGDDSANNWNDIDDVNDLVNIGYPFSQYYLERTFNIISYDTNEYGIEKDYNIDSGLLSLDMYLYYLKNNHSGSTLQISLFDSNDDLKIAILFNNSWSGIYGSDTLDIFYYNGSSFVKYTTQYIPSFEEFQLFIDYGLCNSFNIIFPTLTYNLGLSKIIINATCPTFTYTSASQVVGIGMVQLKSNGTVIADDYCIEAFLTKDIYPSNTRFYFIDYPILQLSNSFKGNISILYANQQNVPETYWFETYSYPLYYITTYNFTESIKRFHFYECGYTITDNLQFFSLRIMSSGLFTSGNFSVKENYLVDITNSLDYKISANFQNVDNNESYFYIQANNLYYTLTSNDSNIESISAIFDFNNFNSDGYALYISIIKNTNDLFAYINLYCTDGTFFQYEAQISYRNIYSKLLSDKSFDYIEFNVSDLSSNLNNTITGYYSSFDFIYVPIYDLPITTASLILVIPIIILIIFVPVFIYFKFGKNPNIVIPSVILMTLLGVIVEVVPLWIGFVVWFSCIGFYILMKRSD